MSEDQKESLSPGQFKLYVLYPIIVLALAGVGAVVGKLVYNAPVNVEYVESNKRKIDENSKAIIELKDRVIVDLESKVNTRLREHDARIANQELTIARISATIKSLTDAMASIKNYHAGILKVIEDLSLRFARIEGAISIKPTNKEKGK